MAVSLEAWSGTRTQVGTIARRAAESRPLTREERVARLQRRRRLSRAQSALEGAVWLAGTAAITLVAFAGLFGLR
jgi:hypothetical protein